MNILIVCYEYPPLGGGGGVAVAGVARELARRHKVDVVTSGAPGHPPLERHPTGDLTVYRAPVLNRSARAVASMASMLSFYPRGVRLGRQLLRQQAYDVINTWFAIPSGPIGVRLATLGRIPHLLTAIGGDIYDPSKWYSPSNNALTRRVVKAVLAGSDATVAISSDVARRADMLMPGQPGVTVVPLGVDPPRVAPATRAELGLDDDGIYIATLGRLVRRKNLPNLLRAVHRIPDPRVRLLLIGDGPEQDGLRALAGELRLGERVHFLGFVDEQRKYQLLAAADLFALVSVHEGFGLVYLEAMHCGLPVVAADVGGHTDFLRDEATGRLVPFHDVAALAAALAQLANQPALRRSVGQRNRRLAADFTMARTATCYENAFEKLVKTVEDGGAEWLGRRAG